MKSNGKRFLSAVVLLLLAGAGTAGARTFAIGAEGKTAGSAIQEAIRQAASGDTILVHPGVYDNFILYITSKSLVVKSVAGPERTILDGGRGHLVAWVRRAGDQTVIEGFTFRNGLDTQFGGGLRLGDDCHPTIRNNIFESCGAPLGGGIYIGPHCRPIIEGNLFVGNSASVEGGGIYAQFASPVIRNNTFVGNDSARPGSAISLFQATPIIERNIFAFQLGETAIYLRGEQCVPATMGCNAYYGNKGRDILTAEGAGEPTETNRMTSDPLFADTKTRRLSDSSPYRDAKPCGTIGW